MRLAATTTVLGLVLVLAPVAMFAYAYFGYPLLLKLVKRRHRGVPVEAIEPAEWPSISIVVPAYNAERTIGRTIDRLLAAVDAEGITPRAPELLGRYVDAIATNTGVLRLQREEPEVFVRLCTTSASSFQTRMVAKVAEVLSVDRASGHLTIDLDDNELAFAVVRLLEAYAHAPTLSGQPADPALATRVLRALLR